MLIKNGSTGTTTLTIANDLVNNGVSLDLLEVNAGNRPDINDAQSFGIRLLYDGSVNMFKLQSGVAGVLTDRFTMDRNTGNAVFNTGSLDVGTLKFDGKDISDSSALINILDDLNGGSSRDKFNTELRSYWVKDSHTNHDG